MIVPRLFYLKLCIVFDGLHTKTHLNYSATASLVVLLEFYLFGLHLALTPLSATTRADVAGVEDVFATMLAFECLHNSNERLSHFLLMCGCCSRRR